MPIERAGTPGRRGYHHGDLQNALTDAAMELAREGGPSAIVLREAARATGVSSTAAYRHFANHGDLVRAVKERGLAVLARTMLAEVAVEPPLTDPGDEAMRRLRAAGRGYCRFAFSEPGLFRTVFHNKMERDLAASGTGSFDEDWTPEGRPRTPDEAFDILARSLDDLVATGRMPAERREFSDVALWGCVHGISVLLLDTELVRLPEEAKTAMVERALDVALNGL